MNTTKIKSLPIIRESKFAFFYFDELEKALFYFYKQTGTKRMRKDDYKEELKVVLEVCLESQATSLVADTMSFDFPITPELQTWTNNNIFAKHLYLEKCAMVTSQDLIGRLALSQTFDKSEALAIRFDAQFFASFQEAIEWIEYSDSVQTS